MSAIPSELARGEPPVDPDPSEPSSLQPRARAFLSAISALAASGPLDVHGLVAGDGGVWLADNTNGVLYRVRG